MTRAVEAFLFDRTEFINMLVDVSLPNNTMHSAKKSLNVQISVNNHIFQRKALCFTKNRLSIHLHTIPLI